jgi:hypothetical protein
MVQSGLLRQSATVAWKEPNGFIPCRAYPQKRWQNSGRSLISGGDFSRRPEILDFAVVAASVAACRVKVRPIFRGAVGSVPLAAGAGEGTDTMASISISSGLPHFGKGIVSSGVVSGK